MDESSLEVPRWEGGGGVVRQLRYFQNNQAKSLLYNNMCDTSFFTNQKLHYCAARFYIDRSGHALLAISLQPMTAQKILLWFF